MSFVIKISFIFAPLLILIYCTADRLNATETYAEQTGKDCSICHVDPAGGTELTVQGLDFKKTCISEGQDVVKRSMMANLIRFIAGYVHIVTAIFWFGTILYVHLILKPAYAARGLPRGEVRVGLLSMLIMFVTGIVLLVNRISSLLNLFETRFGILLSIKIVLFMFMVITALIAVLFVGPRLRQMSVSSGGKAVNNMTIEELLSFDGKEGRPAYIAYNGSIYDVSNSGIWLNGIHFFKHPAGIDLTEYLKKAPHDEDRVLRMPKIGIIVSGAGKKERSKFERIFYFIAYFNLTLVLLIILILALWRWG
jgi:predicted heme/steroid binding protein